MYSPRPVELTASDEMVALENLQILQQNGFELDVNEDNPVGQGSRLKLTAQPVSKDTVFDMKGRSGIFSANSNVSDYYRFNRP